MSAPRRTRALAGLCVDLTATKTTYPGTDLTLVYTVKDRPLNLATTFQVCQESWYRAPKLTVDA